MGGGRQITKKECRSRTPFVSPEIFPCDLIAGKESWRANDEERCPSRLLQIEGGGGESSHRWMTVLQTLGTISTNGWNCSRTIYNRVSARHPRRGRRGGPTKTMKLKRNVLENFPRFFRYSPPLFVIFIHGIFLSPYNLRLVNCASPVLGHRFFESSNFRSR